MTSIRFPSNLADHCPEQWSSEQITTLDVLHRNGFATSIYGQGIGSNAMFIQYWDAGEAETWLNPTIEALITPTGDVLVLDYDLEGGAA